MPIEFNSIPSDVRVPLAYVEFDNTRAQSALVADAYTILVIGQRLASGSVKAGVPTQVQSEPQAEDYFGRGSMLAAMIGALKSANRYTKCMAIALDDDPTAVAAAGSIDFAGPATGAGTLHLYIAGQAVKVKVSSGDTGDNVATNVAAAINANTALPVTAAVDATTTTKVDITARNLGEAGNDIDIRLNYYAGEATPKGLQPTITAMTGGTTNPDVSTAIAAMGDSWYQVIVMPYTDASNLTTLETELTSRWGPTRQIDGIAYAAFRGTSAATDTFGGTQNSPYLSVMATNIAPQPPYVWAASVAGAAAASLAIDPARPLQTLTLPGLMPAAEDVRFTWDERDLMLHSGIASHKVDAGGNVLIERLITTYQTNSYGVADTSYLDVNTLATLSYIRYQTRARITQRFPRYKLAGDTVPVSPGQKIATPKVIRAELIALAKDLLDQAIIEDLQQFKNDLVVEIDANDPNRCNVLSSPNLVNQLRIFAEQIQFIL